ncbi:pyocin activator protein PrtN, phage related protein [Roseivirga seohaensis subsp. aquiponti]|uniref:Pyocin activator protein PrtN, phage related protein n=1 Tax=Roseivirga seohaensis subsp. aquiponti TaxID=1566026 RepID=A0A0L8APR4_9BACT|nr:pyocin activator PrtN family protein [Roseivirga seohaensis]KOF04167.1 pyocin activator protein PrtN, phage related protein [Roseivirga seohaensis subsp. aquiponti]
MNKTELMLLMKYESPIVPLEKICEAYFGCSKNTAKQKAKSGTLPVPAFRLGKSQKLPWMINIQDLASFIEKNSSEAKREWVGTISQ